MKNDAKARISLLEKIAKKPQTAITPLLGKVDRKQLEKQLDIARGVYKVNFEELSIARSEADRINKIIEDRQSKMDVAKSEISKLYTLMHKMDMLSVSMVKIDKDDNNLAFMKENRWFHLNDGDNSLTPYRQYIKSKNPEAPEDQLLDDDFLNDSNNEFEGVDIVKE